MSLRLIYTIYHSKIFYSYYQYNTPIFELQDDFRKFHGNFTATKT